ncbi:MAG: CocE/NonD family hydrolase [Burkholderiaceae bacterium]
MTRAAWIGVLLVLGALSAVAAAAAWSAGGWRSAAKMAAGRVEARLASIDVRRDVRIPMPDGVVLSADLYLPAGPERRVPTVLLRTPYLRDTWQAHGSEALDFARHGFAVVVQSMRGRFGSGGEFAPYAKSADDGRATLDWIVAQPWSNGRVGTYGCSALGETQLILGATRHPALRAMVPQSAGGGVGSAGGRYGYFGIFEGGIPLLSSSAGWFFSNGAKTSAESREQLAHPPRGRGPGGQLSLQQLPVLDLVRSQSPYPTDFELLMSLPLTSPEWARLGYLKDGDRFAAPALHVNSWFDQGVSSTLFAARFMAAHADTPEARHQPVVIGPGMHCTVGYKRAPAHVGDLRIDGPNEPLLDTYLAWFDRWLRDDPAAGASGTTRATGTAGTAGAVGAVGAAAGAGAAASAARPAIDALPAYRFYVLREDRWMDADAWPPPAARPRRWYLDSGGGANTAAGDGRLVDAPRPGQSIDRFTYDPADPVPTRGGTFCCTGDGLAREGAVDQRDVEARRDVLVYTSAPLAAPLRITGTVRARLHVATSARDTDFTARLVDVAPDGPALNIRDSGLRLRYRDGIDRPAPAEPGAVYSIDIELGDIAWQVPAGHRLRLQVSSSNFPRFERNLNTGGRNVDETTSVTAVNDVRHGTAYPSWIEFPVLE